MFSLHTYEGGLQPSRRRSLFTLASSMLIFSARAGSIPELIPFVREPLTEKTVSAAPTIQIEAYSTSPFSFLLVLFGKEHILWGCIFDS